MLQTHFVENGDTSLESPSEHMHEIGFSISKLRDLEIVVCDYELTRNIDPMDGFFSIYLHNTYKFTDLNKLLDFHRACGFAGIGYHFAIAENGQVYQTRPLDIQGAHVYGRNKNSVGLVLLDVDKCARSRRARRSFKKLHRVLSEEARFALPVHSHTFGQFEYLNKLIKVYNEGAEVEFPAISYDVSVCEDAVLNAKRAEVLDAIIRHRQRGIPEDGWQAFNNIVRFSDKLKSCPGEKYKVFR